MSSPHHPPARPAHVLARITEIRLIAVVRSPSHEEALRMSRVLLEAGVKALEITYTTPAAAEVIGELRASIPSDALLGAGTIVTAAQARQAADAGADFLVSPGSASALIESMLATECLVVPGVFTPTEIIATQRLGIHAVKLFPASLLGPAGLKTLRGPFPKVAFIPSGGIAPGNVDAWLTAGAVAVGVGAGGLEQSIRQHATD